MVTYNVHACRGGDGRHDPDRISRVLAELNPGLVCLQEVDVGRGRSAGCHQDERIARMLGMNVTFAPTVHFARGAYGNAILCRHPLELVRMASLPTPRWAERRGAVWMRLRLAGRSLELISTHLGLGWASARRQARALMGEEWLGDVLHADRPVLLCGDLNSASTALFARGPRGGLVDVRRRIRSRLRNGTFPASWPVLALDRILVSHHFEVRHVEVPRSAEACRASDHLPLLAELGFGGNEDPR